MRGIFAIGLIHILLAVGLVSGASRAPDSQSKTYGDTRRLLLAMNDVRANRDQLVILFREGDNRIAALVQLLDDQDRSVSLRAQMVIRYLGNKSGTQALYEWYKKQSELSVAGPIPVPLSEWDYVVIKANLIDKAPRTWGDYEVRYIYALALDGSVRAKAVLDELIKSARDLDDSNFAGHAIKTVQRSNPNQILTGEKDLAKLVLDNAFFISPGDRKYTSARFLGFNGDEDKALVEVYINRGALAEEWYHVVVSKRGQGWIFFSVTQIAIS